MPNNEENKQFSNNDLENNDLPKEVSNENNKPLIEIPQEYYDKIAMEKEEKMALERKQQEEQQQRNENRHNLNKALGSILINAIILFGLLYAMINIKEIIILIIPLYIIISSIVLAITKKSNSNQPLAILIGGMIIAVISFVVSMTNEKQVDLWTYYAIASAIIAFLGFISSSLITKAIVNKIKALQTLGMILFFGAILGIPYYIYTKYPEEFYRYVFLKQTEVKAETEEEFIIKTLKTRYNKNFTCPANTIKNQVDQNLHRRSERLCYDEKKNEVIVSSTVYNEINNQYIIQDNYMDVLLLNSEKEKIKNELSNVITATKINVYFYPKQSLCILVGDCVDNDDYFARYEQIENIENQYKESYNLNLSKYVNVKATEFIDDYKFKYVFTLSGVFNESNYTEVINSILNQLNKNGYKNYFGYVIVLYDNSIPGGIAKAYEAKGEATSDLTFKDPEIKEF